MSETIARWMLDRIKQGQFSDLGKFSTTRLEGLAEKAAAAYASLPESREADRGRLMLLRGRIELELRHRAHRRERQGVTGRGLARMSADDFQALGEEMIARAKSKGRRK